MIGSSSEYKSPQYLKLHILKWPRVIISRKAFYYFTSFNSIQSDFSHITFRISETEEKKKSPLFSKHITIRKEMQLKVPLFLLSKIHIKSYKHTF